MNDATEKLPDFDDAEASWGAMKLRSDRTGLPMAVWITPNDDYPHAARIKVATIHGGGGSWRSNSVPVAVLPRVRQVASARLSVADIGLVRRWIELNHQLLIDVWDGRVDAVAEEVYPRLQRLP